MTTLTDYKPDPKRFIPPEDVLSVSDPDENGKVRAVVKLGSALVLVEGRRIFEIDETPDRHPTTKEE